MFFSNKIKLDELGRPSESGRPSAMLAQFWTSIWSGSGSGGRMPPPPLNSRGRRWRLLVYSSSRKKPRSACSRQRPEGRARQPDTSVQTDTSKPLFTHPPVHQAPSARLRNSASLRRSAAPSAFWTPSFSHPSISFLPPTEARFARSDRSFDSAGHQLS